ncbi:MAG: ABC transporter ATP-binding protein [Proteobacteria bacterium]|nr:ABC transporter ATP-binding protein [Pseudomonadota bacterium]
MLELVGLHKTFSSGVRALDGISLRLERGIFGLLGPNGAGKSTLMRIVATLLAPDAGTFRLAGVDGLARPDAIRRCLGYLPQDFGVYPRVTTEALLEHIAAMKGLRGGPSRRGHVHDLLQYVNLFDVRRRRLGELSGGMKQRFGVAQALLGHPRLLILDEPTAGLDPLERQRFHDLLGETGESAVVIVSTHIVEDVASLCNRLAIVAGGRLVAEGTPEGLMERFAGRIWQQTVSRAEVAPAPASGLVVSRRLARGKVILRVLADSPPGRGYATVPPNLEDVYFASLPASSG